MHSMFVSWPENILKMNFSLSQTAWAKPAYYVNCTFFFSRWNTRYCNYFKICINTFQIAVVFCIHPNPILLYTKKYTVMEFHPYITNLSGRTPCQADTFRKLCLNLSALCFAAWLHCSSQATCSAGNSVNAFNYDLTCVFVRNKRLWTEGDD